MMPQMGYDMKEGRLVKWLKKEGEAITSGEDIAEIETDKAIIPMSSPSEGVLRKIITPEGEMVPVGTILGIIGSVDEDISSKIDAIITETASIAKPENSNSPQESKKETTTETKNLNLGTVNATPIAKKIATDKNIDLSLITGTGPNGRIVEKDVLNYSESSVSVPDISTLPKVKPLISATSEIIELSRMRKAVARTTSASSIEAPHFYVTTDIDMTESMKMRIQANKALEVEGKRISVNDFILKACAVALLHHPNFNATFHGDTIEIHSNINIGVAIDLDGSGLIQPAIMACQKLSLVEISVGTKDLITRARGNQLRAEEYTGSTFTISNLGMFSIESFTAIIAPPNCAILAVGSVRDTPVVSNGEIAIKQMMKVTLSVDHRSNDGAAAARFAGEIKTLLEQPVSLLL
jgi:pyruvate dehydrogenase E2 component (dihydrolipoamide acetyltransferase)